MTGNQVKKNLNESALFRWTVLILMCLITFSGYYFYDVFSAIKITLQAETGISNEGYGLMYGAYSFTNAFLLMTFFGGIILDKWGVRKTGTIFILFWLLGASITAYGASTFFKPGAFGYLIFNSFLPQYSPSLKMMITGRLIFGLGAETIYVLIMKIVVKWFKGKEMALAISLFVAFARIGTAATLTFSPILVGVSQSVNNAAWFGLMLAVIGFFAFFFYTFLDIKFDKNAKINGTDKNDEKFKLSDVLLLIKNSSFIYVSLLCLLFYAAVLPFLGFAPDFLHNKFGFSLKMSGDITTILPYGTIIFTPIFGWFCDTKGKSALLMIFGSLILVIVFLILALTTIPPYIPLFFLGITFSLLPAAMWPSVIKIVGENLIGSAYGIMFTLQNLGMMLIPIIMGLVLDNTNKALHQNEPLNYTYVILMLAFIGVIGIVFAILLKHDDKTSGYGLELPNKMKDS